MGADPLIGQDDTGLSDGPNRRVRSGSLIVVGTGIEAVGQATLAAEGAIRTADIVFYAVSDVLTVDWILSLNPAAESLFPFYAPGRDRRVTYRLTVERVMSAVRGGRRVCMACYGHPGIAAIASHRAIFEARTEGYSARMLPGVSALDCLVCDLGVDLGVGFQSYEATRFLVHRRDVNAFCPLILWQIGMVGDVAYTPGSYARRGYDVLVEALSEIYGSEHEVILYEAAVWTVCEPRIEAAPVKDLAAIKPTSGSTLYVPAKAAAPRDDAMIERLELRDVIQTAAEQL